MPIQNAKKSNEERYVEEKAREAHKRFAFSHYDSHGTWIKEMKDFIRTIVSEVERLTSDKPKVSKQQILDLIGFIAGIKIAEWDGAYLEATIIGVKIKLEKMGVEMEE